MASPQTKALALAKQVDILAGSVRNIGTPGLTLLGLQTEGNAFLTS